MARCFRCEAELPRRIYRTTICESCGADAKVCLNCDFYDPGAHWECRESITEAVREKDRANFCDFFRATTGSGSATGGQGKADDSSTARDAFSKLFGDE